MNDHQSLGALRENVERFLREEAAKLRAAEGEPPPLVLEVGGEGRGYGPLFFPGCRHRTLDLNPQHSPDFVADLGADSLPYALYVTFDVILCTEVLEHVRRPWVAAYNLWRMLKPGGKLLLSTPLNLFVHYPSPDCWRFTRDGLAELLRDFAAVEITELPTPGRDGFPIQYTTVATRGE